MKGVGSGGVLDLSQESLRFAGGLDVGYERQESMVLPKVLASEWKNRGRSLCTGEHFMPQG